MATERTGTRRAVSKRTVLTRPAMAPGEKPRRWYCAIPACVQRAAELTAADKVVYGVLLDRLRMDRPAHLFVEASQQQIADWSGEKLSTVRRALERLEKHWHLLVVRRSRKLRSRRGRITVQNRPNRYGFRNPWLLFDASVYCDEELATVVPGPEDMLLPGMRGYDPEANRYKTQKPAGDSADENPRGAQAPSSKGPTGADQASVA